MFPKILTQGLRMIAAGLLCASLTACAPELNWREVRGDDAHFSVLLPSKPATHARTIDLDGLAVEMSMTGASVGELSFIVASARIPDASRQPAALAAMQTAMLRNVHASTHAEKAVTLKGGVPAIEVSASGQAARDGRPLQMQARFAAYRDRVYQAVALGPKDKLLPDAAETFLASLSLH